MNCPEDNLGMLQSFLFKAVDPASFDDLFGMSDQELGLQGAIRVVADGPGYPCRVSLADAENGDEVLLLNFAHLQGDTPFRASGPIYVRKSVKMAAPEPGIVPTFLKTRLLSVRAYDEASMMIDAAVIFGETVEEQITMFFKNPNVAFLQIHFAKRGCYACQVYRT